MVVGGAYKDKVMVQKVIDLPSACLRQVSIGFR
jgi:hypothetical protein